MKRIEELTHTRRAHMQSLLAAVLTASVPARLLAQANEQSFTPPELARLSTEQAEHLLAVARTLFPHDMLADRFYWPIVSTIDSMMSDEETRGTIAEGVTALGSGFSKLDQADREVALAELEGGPFFSLMYTQTLNGLYLNEELWQIFGYEGSSIEHGGYLNRGFDQVDWLPQDEEMGQ